MADKPVKPRVVWVDIAKGISILTVVFLHLSTWGIDTGNAPGLWYNVSANFIHLRLPLFFMVSGLFAAKIRRFTFAELIVKRTWLWGVPFILWGAIVLLASHFIRGTSLDHFWSQWGRGIIFPENGIWFLMALLVFTFVIWVFRRVRGRYVLAVSFALTLIAPFIGGSVQAGPLWSWTRLAMYFSSYCIGLYGREIVIRVAAKSRWYHALILFALLIVMEKGYRYINNEFLHTSANILLIGYGLITGVAIAVALDGTYFGKLLSYIGRHTLEIYLLNEILVWVFYKDIFPLIDTHTGSDMSTWQEGELFIGPRGVLSSMNFWAPLIGLVFVTGVSLLIRELVRGSRLDYVFTPPTFAWMTRWVEKSIARRAQRHAEARAQAVSQGRQYQPENDETLLAEPDVTTELLASEKGLLEERAAHHHHDADDHVRRRRGSHQPEQKR